jgi:flagellar biosynthetic protein FliR
MSSLVLTFSLLLARVGTFVTVLPLFGKLAPRLVKAGLALSLSVFFFLSLYGGVTYQQWTAHAMRTGWIGYGVLLIREVILGALLGYAFGLFLAPAQIAGEYLTEEMGLSFGNQINPGGGSSSGALTQAIQVFAAYLFLGVDGHHTLVVFFYSLFARYPIGGAMPAWQAPQLVRGLAAAEEWGLLLAMPIGACLFLTTVVLALMTKAAPQLNLYSVGFPLRLATGLVGLLLFFPQLARNLVTVFGRFEQLLARLV